MNTARCESGPFALYPGQKPDGKILFIVTTYLYVSITTHLIELRTAEVLQQDRSD